MVPSDLSWLLRFPPRYVYNRLLKEMKRQLALLLSHPTNDLHKSFSLGQRDPTSGYNAETQVIPCIKGGPTGLWGGLGLLFLAFPPTYSDRGPTFAFRSFSVVCHMLYQACVMPTTLCSKP